VQRALEFLFDYGSPFSYLKQEDMLSPAAIAESFWHVAHQDRSAWTQELDLRPFAEKF
jgi:hypothetical protein